MAIDRSFEARSVDRTRNVDTGISLDKDLSRSIRESMGLVNPADVSAEAGHLAANDEVADGFEATESRTHTVRPGDNLTHIARDHGVSLADVIAANPQIRNPNRIYPGDQVTIPPGGRAPSGGVTGTGDVLPEDGVLARGHRGPPVADLQQRLNDLGFASGEVDGVFGPITQGAVRRFQMQNDLNTTGRLDAETAARLNSPDVQRYEPGAVPELGTYPPGSQEQVALFQEAARQIGVPESWASDPGLINILRRESGGRVGVPNYTYGARAGDPSQWGSVHDELRAGRITARSSATGLGQLLLRNVDTYYPSGRAGIGNPVEEAAGMMAYIRDRYGSPAEAWRQYGVNHEGY